MDVTPAGQPSNANIFTTRIRSTHRLQIATGLQWKGASPRSQTRLVGSYHTAPCGHMNKTHADAACSHMSPAPLLPKAREKHARLLPCGNDGAVVERQRAPRDAQSLLKHYIIILRGKNELMMSTPISARFSGNVNAPLTWPLMDGYELQKRSAFVTKCSR